MQTPNHSEPLEMSS